MKYKVDFEIELKKNTNSGLYIALEGIDGSGKTTQVESLQKYFKSHGREVVVTAEPSRDGIIGEIIHKILKEEISIPRIFHQYLFSIDRGIHQQDLIIPSLVAGKVVISDRSFWSGLAYGMLDKEAADGNVKDQDQVLVLLSILSMYHQFTSPDITIYLDVNTTTAIERLKGLQRKAELYENHEMLEKVKRIYDLILNKFSDSFFVVDGDRDIETITNDILKKAEELK
jgi:dTMP kinase